MNDTQALTLSPTPPFCTVSFRGRVVLVGVEMEGSGEDFTKPLTTPDHVSGSCRVVAFHRGKISTPVTQLKGEGYSGRGYSEKFDCAIEECGVENEWESMEGKSDWGDKKANR